MSLRPSCHRQNCIIFTLIYSFHAFCSHLASHSHASGPTLSIKPQWLNLSTIHKRTLFALRGDKSRTIKPADKGSCIVVQDTINNLLFNCCNTLPALSHHFISFTTLKGKLSPKYYRIYYSSQILVKWRVGGTSCHLNALINQLLLFIVTQTIYV